MTPVEVKICGLTSEVDAGLVIEGKSDYAGFVMFHPQSKRNIDGKTVAPLVSKLKENKIKTVAVTVSPKMEQVQEIIDIGFDYIQIHGDIFHEVMENCSIPIIRAINLKTNDLEKIQKEIDDLKEINKIYGILFDAGMPGSGKVFDWNSLKGINAGDKKMFLAGGLTPLNVSSAICEVKPDVVDVSSGVEYDDASRVGKCKEKVMAFLCNARKVRGK